MVVSNRNLQTSRSLFSGATLVSGRVMGWKPLLIAVENLLRWSKTAGWFSGPMLSCTHPRGEVNKSHVCCFAAKTTKGVARRTSSSWWFQPIWKIWSSKWIISPNMGENKIYSKPPPSHQFHPLPKTSTKCWRVGGFKFQPYFFLKKYWSTKKAIFPNLF